MSNFSASRASCAMIAFCLGLILSLGINDASAATVNGAAAPQETWIATFYTIILTLLLIIGFIAAAAGQRIWVPYVGLGIVSLVWLGLTEQVSSNVFAPGLQLPPRSVIFYGYVNAALNFAVAAFSTARNSRHKHRRLQFSGLALLSLFAVSLTWFMSDSLAALVMYVAIVAAVLSHLVAVETFPQFGRESDRYDRFGMYIFIAALIVTATVIALGFVASGALYILLARALLAGFVLFGGFMAFYRVLATTREREQALGEALAAAKRDATMSRALLEAERNYAVARDIAGARAQQLATASHDIKQPLTSLRTTIDTIIRDQPEELKAQLRNSFDYLEQLATSYMDKGQQNNSTETGETGVETATSSDTGIESVPARLFLDTLDRMFRAEAEQRGLSFSVTDADVFVKTAPLTVMRILSNLVSNAIHHADGGCVEIGATLADKSVLFFVRNNVKNLSEADIERYFDLNAKSETSTGQGLGLAIVKKLAADAGLELSFQCARSGKGTCEFILSVPTST